MGHLLLYLVLLGILSSGIASPLSHDNSWQMLANDEGFNYLVDPVPFDLQETPEQPLFNPEQDVRFLLYTRSNPDTPQRIANNDPASVEDSYFNASNPTRIVIHGWMGGEQSSINHLIRHELFELDEFNVIFVDWSAGNDLFYPNSRRLVFAVGIATSNLIDFLARVAYLDRDDVVVVGHSLGAHVAGNVGKGQGGRLPTIIGLDPALPFFGGSDILDRIMSSDAEYVEIIHTNGGVLGILEPIGDADFYPNWGRIQPGCGVDIEGSCAHQRAVDYYVESLRSQVGFEGRQCGSFQEIRGGQCAGTGVTARMGGEPPNRGAEVRGVFFLATAGQSPFARG